MKTKLSSEDVTRMAEILKVISHPVRLEIIHTLKDFTELTVGDIQKELDCNCEQSMLSHHLNKMKDKGLLKSRKEGKFIKYSILDNNIVIFFDYLK